MSTHRQEHLFAIYSSLARWQCSEDAPELAENVMTSIPLIELKTYFFPGSEGSYLEPRPWKVNREQDGHLMFCARGW